MYAYCGNDPINYADPSGHISISTLILCGLALVGMGLTIGGVIVLSIGFDHFIRWISDYWD